MALFVLKYIIFKTLSLDNINFKLIILLYIKLYKGCFYYFTNNNDNLKIKAEFKFKYTRIT